MKKYIATIAAMGIAASVLAQGTVNFALNATGFRAQIYGPEVGNPNAIKTGNSAAGLPAGTQVYTGELLAGTAYLVQLWGVSGAGAAEGSLIAQSPTTTFRTGTAAGLIPTPNIITLTGIAKDAAPNTVTFQLRAWDNSSGLYGTWAQAEAAWNTGLIAAGKSLTWTYGSPIGGDVNAPLTLLGAQSFNIYFIPEPTTFALLGLGALGMLIFRRK